MNRREFTQTLAAAPIVNGPEAIEYLDIPFPATRPKG